MKGLVMTKSCCLMQVIHGLWKASVKLPWWVFKTDNRFSWMMAIVLVVLHNERHNTHQSESQGRICCRVWDKLDSQTPRMKERVAGKFIIALVAWLILLMEVCFPVSSPTLYLFIFFSKHLSFCLKKKTRQSFLCSLNFMSVCSTPLILLSSFVLFCVFAVFLTDWRCHRK